MHCTALHCTALHCIALHCIALHCIALHCIALHCIALLLLYCIVTFDEVVGPEAFASLQILHHVVSKPLHVARCSGRGGRGENVGDTHYTTYREYTYYRDSRHHEHSVTMRSLRTLMYNKNFAPDNSTIVTLAYRMSVKSPFFKTVFMC